MFDSIAALVAEHEALQEQLGDPAVHADAARAKKLNRRYAELSQIVPALSLFAAGQLHMALRKWTMLRRSTASSFELPLMVGIVVAGVVLPLAAYYGDL